MTNMPDEIWAWLFNESLQDDAITGGWTHQQDNREVKYIRADTHEAKIAAIRAIRNELSWSPKTRAIAAKITAALGEAPA